MIRDEVHPPIHQRISTKTSISSGGIQNGSEVNKN
jgi:hypothetical protein